MCSPTCPLIKGQQDQRPCCVTAGLPGCQYSSSFQDTWLSVQALWRDPRPALTETLVGDCPTLGWGRGLQGVCLLYSLRAALDSAGQSRSREPGGGPRWSARGREGESLMAPHRHHAGRPPWSAPEQARGGVSVVRDWERSPGVILR